MSAIQKKESPLKGKIADLGHALAGETISQISLDLIDEDPNNTRTKYDPAKMEALTASIKKRGVLQAIVVRRMGGRFMIVFGHRRYRGARAAGLTTIPVVVRELDDATIKAHRLIENAHREDVDPMDQAMAIKSYIDDHLGGMAHGVGKLAAEHLSFSEATVSEALALLELSEPVQAAVASGNVKAGSTAVALDRLVQEDPAAGAALVEKAKTAPVHREEVRQAQKAAKQKKKAATADDSEQHARCEKTTDMFGGQGEVSDNTDAGIPNLSAIGNNQITESDLVDALGALLKLVDSDLAPSKRIAALVRQIRLHALALGLNWDEILDSAAYDVKENNKDKTHGGTA